MEEIIELFRTRDNAVAQKNSKLFLSTQVDEIANASVSGYLSMGKLTSEVLVQTPGLDDLTTVVFVKETYHSSDNVPHHGYLLYYLVRTSQGHKIYKVVF